MEEKSQNPEVQIPNRPPAGEVGRSSVYVGRRSLGSSATRVADHLGSDTSRLVGHGEVVLRRFRAGTRVVQGACVVDRRSSTAASSRRRVSAQNDRPRPSTPEATPLPSGAFQRVAPSPTGRLVWPFRRRAPCRRVDHAPTPHPPTRHPPTAHDGARARTREACEASEGL